MKSGRAWTHGANRRRADLDALHAAGGGAAAEHADVLQDFPGAGEGERRLEGVVAAEARGGVAAVEREQRALDLPRDGGVDVGEGAEREVRVQVCTDLR